MKKRGMTFLETITSLVIVSLGSLFLYMNISKILEERDLELARLTIVKTFIDYTEKSSRDKNIYKLDIVLDKKRIEVKNFLDKEIERIYLPENLFYEVVYDRKKYEVFETQTTREGNLSKAFTLYIFNKNKKVRNRLGFYTFSSSKIFKINIYINKSAGEIDLNEIITYHYSEDGQNRKGWINE